jgi:endonuclease YncB( thermonuclease family)
MGDMMNRRARAMLFAGVAVASLAAIGWLLDGRSAEVVGAARVIDGDSIVVADTEIRLYGIDAPEYRQTCLRAGFAWRCGVEAANVMRSMVAGREVRCRPREVDRYGRTVALCFVGALDLGAAMVKGGFAVAYGAYQADEREARDARRGMWSSSFELPAAWRARHRRTGR